MPLTRFELFSRQFVVSEAQFFIRLATELYDQWQINELMFYSAAYRLSSYRNSYIKYAPSEIRTLFTMNYKC